MRAVASAAFRILADTAFPPRCPSCRGNVAADGNFCAECFPKLRMISAPLCDICGIPFIIPVEAGTQCPHCLETLPKFDRARAVMVYDNISAPLITALKFHDQWTNVNRMVQMMLATGNSLLADTDAILPVPLHWRRLIGRKYNQSALLAYGLSKATNIPCVTDVLRRVRPTPPQMRLDRATRLRNVRRAFAVDAAAAAQIKGKTLLLVDDVVTTGATADACARVLKKAGAKEVRVLSLARTVKE